MTAIARSRTTRATTAAAPTPPPAAVDTTRPTRPSQRPGRLVHLPAPACLHRVSWPRAPRPRPRPPVPSAAKVPVPFAVGRSDARRVDLTLLSFARVGLPAADGTAQQQQQSWNVPSRTRSSNAFKRVVRPLHAWKKGKQGQGA
ncbi:hypothetical protein FB451DRAFT_1561944 [Mycena latifolia]|nr:hypothetical protein FB451DRAFT_1561944 [Mycena latifolia]